MDMGHDEASWYADVVAKADSLPADDAIAWLTASIAETKGRHPNTADLAWRLGLAHSDAFTGHAQHFLHLASEMATGAFKDIVLLDLFIEALCIADVDDDTWDLINNPWAVGAETPWGGGEVVDWPTFRTDTTSHSALANFVRPMRTAVREGGLASAEALIAGYRGLTWLIDEEHENERKLEDWLHGIVRIRCERQDDSLRADMVSVAGMLAEPEPFAEAVRAVWMDGTSPV
ncbi:MAG: hypothetical protein ACJAZO_004648 [Myxococcota bacterium]|jgi:hypothetical protein